MADPTNRAELLAKIDSTWSDFIRALDSVPPEMWDMPGVCGYWSVGELVAHISFWESKVPEYVQRDHLSLRTSDDHPSLGGDVDEQNMIVASASRYVDNVTLERELWVTHVQMLRSVADAPDEISSDLLAEIACETWDHYPEHTAQLVTWASAVLSPGALYRAIATGTLAMADAIDPETRATPGADGEWSVKDAIAHLAFWDADSKATLDFKAGRRTSPPADGDYEEINLEVAAKRADWSWTNVSDDALDTIDGLAPLLDAEAIPGEDPVWKHWLDHASNIRDALYDGLLTEDHE